MTMVVVQAVAGRVPSLTLSRTDLPAARAAPLARCGVRLASRAARLRHSPGYGKADRSTQASQQDNRPGRDGDEHRDGEPQQQERDRRGRGQQDDGR
jgi:hypothetical protein